MGPLLIPINLFFLDGVHLEQNSVLNLYCVVLLYMGELVNLVRGFGFVLFFG